MENLESIQDLIFILEYKLHFQESEALNIERWVAKKRIKQYKEYKKEEKESLKKATEHKKGTVPRIKR
jgi:hypothetical protein